MKQRINDPFVRVVAFINVVFFIAISVSMVLVTLYAKVEEPIWFYGLLIFSLLLSWFLYWHSSKRFRGCRLKELLTFTS